VGSRGSRYYKFENMWLKLGGFEELVKIWCVSYSYQGSPSYVSAQKLKALKSDLKVAKRKEMGDGLCELDIIVE
jgi:hypothetical protein